MAFDVEEAEFEHGEQADGPGADDDDVRFDMVGHEQAPSGDLFESTVSWFCNAAGHGRSAARRGESDFQAVEFGRPEDLAGQARVRAA